MRKLLFVSALVSILPQFVMANNQIEIRNNTDIPITVTTPSAIDGLMECKSSPFGFCFKQIDPTEIKAHDSAKINIETAVTDQKLYWGSIGFEVKTVEGTFATFTIPAMANPSIIQILAGQQPYKISTNTYSINSLPKYTVAILQNLAKLQEIGAVNETVVLVNAVNR